MGSIVKNMREQLIFLSQLVDQGKIIITPYTKILFLTSERALFKSENQDVLLNPIPYKAREGLVAPRVLPNDERNAAKFIWDQLEIANDLRDKLPIFVEANKKINTSRAETEDTVEAYLSRDDIQDGTGVIISNNPYIYYQEKVMEPGIKKSPSKRLFKLRELGVMLIFQIKKR